MRHLHGIHVLPWLSERDMANAAYAHERGRKVRIRTTPQTRVTTIEEYRPYVNYRGGVRHEWQEIQGGWNRTVAESKALAARFDPSKITIMEGKK